MSKRSSEQDYEHAKNVVTKAPTASCEQRIVAAKYAFTGPLPDPNTLERYSQIEPNEVVQSVIKMAVDQAHHRQECERRQTMAETRNSLLGIIAGWTIAFAGLGAAVWIAHMGYPTAAAVVGSLDLAALVAVFVHGIQRRGQVVESQTQAPPQGVPRGLTRIEPYRERTRRLHKPCQPDRLQADALRGQGGVRGALVAACSGP